MEYVLPKHVAEFIKERDTLNKRIQELEVTVDMLRTNVEI